MGAEVSEAPAAPTPGTATELARLVRLGTPVALAQLALMGMGVVDTLFAGRVSAEDLAGVALGGNVLWPTLLLLMGALMALTPNVAQLHGAGRTHEIGELVRQGVWLALGLAAPAVLVLSQGGAVYRLVGADPAILPYAIAYLDWVRLGVPAVLLFVVGRYLCDGLGDTRPAMVVTGAAFLLNAFLDWVFVFGRLGAPALGGPGCGLATALVLWFELLAMAAIVCLRRYRVPTRLFERFSPPDPRRLAALVRLGIPIGLASFFEVAAFSIVTLLVARLGAVAVAAQQIAFSINGILFMIPMSLGMAATIRIGHHLGAGRREDARHTARVAMTASVTLGLAFAAFVALLRTPLVALYTTEADVVRLGARLLLFLAVYIVVDSMQATAIGALRGYKDTRAPMLITLFGYWIVAVPLGSGLGLGWVGPGLGVDGFWIGLATGLAVVAFGLSARLLRVAAPRTRAAA